MRKEDIEAYLAQLGQELDALGQQLNIQTREQAQTLIDRYIPDKPLQRASNVEDTLDTFF